MHNQESAGIVQINKYEVPSKWKMSVVAIDQGCTGIFCPRDVGGLSLCLYCEYFTVHNLK